MGDIMEKKCDRCAVVISEEDSYTYLNETLCEDCYMDAMSSTKACDPWAVQAATRERGNRNLRGDQGLTDLQKSIYKFVEARGRALPEEITGALKISNTELERQFTILRHCELLKGCKEGDKVYITIFNK